MHLVDIYNYVCMYNNSTLRLAFIAVEPTMQLALIGSQHTAHNAMQLLKTICRIIPTCELHELRTYTLITSYILILKPFILVHLALDIIGLLLANTGKNQSFS